MLNDKEEELTRLAVLEGMTDMMDHLAIDFKVNWRSITVHQRKRFGDIEELLYTLCVEMVEDHGVLQSKYDPETII
jgi:hypothetical protein